MDGLKGFDIGAVFVGVLFFGIFTFGLLFLFNLIFGDGIWYYMTSLKIALIVGIPGGIWFGKKDSLPPTGKSDSKESNEKNSNDELLDKF